MKKILLFGCGGVAALGLLLLIAFALFAWHVSKQPEGMKLTVNSPATVARGKEFDLVLNIANDRASDSLTVSDIEIGEEYLKGFVVLSAEPAYVSSSKNALVDNRTFTFNHAIPAKSTNAITFKLMARKAGKYTTELSVGVGLRTITMVVETQVE